MSGLCVNKQKSEAMVIGSTINENFGSGIKWVNCLKILHVHFSGLRNASDIEEKWKSKLTRTRGSITNLEKRNLGLLGKISLIKSLLLSQLIYAMQAICFPIKVLKEINTKILMEKERL